MRIYRLVLFALFVLGLAIRLCDLTDPPLDYHPTRQLHMAIIARGLYYQISPSADARQTQLAIALGNSMGQYEPHILDTVLAYTYKLAGGERLWFARIYNSLFWLIGGAALFALARRMASLGGAIVALSFYLFLPFGVFGSRALLPDVGMVMWILLAAYAFHRWGETPQWKWAVFAGVAAGMAIYTKVNAAPVIGGLTIATVLFTPGLRRAFRQPQVWAIAVLMVTPALFYQWFGMHGQTAGRIENWTVAMLYLLIEPSFYVRWLNLLQNEMGLTVLLLGVAGLVTAKPFSRAQLVGLWVGYGLYGMVFPHQITTHNYYSLLFVPIVALSLAPLGVLLFEKLSQLSLFWRAIVLGAALIVTAHQLWFSYSVLVGQDFRDVPAYWQKVEQALPPQGKIIALTQDYGERLMYYGWRKVSLWPNQASLKLSEKREKARKDFEVEFASRTEGKDYFLITSFDQLDKQPLLKEMLNRYPVYAKGDGYLIFALRSP